jgi:hypothetical protein
VTQDPAGLNKLVCDSEGHQRARYEFQSMDAGSRRPRIAQLKENVKGNVLKVRTPARQERFAECGLDSSEIKRG